ncbi:Glyoxalase, partial [Dysosmobacter welbionis]
MWAASPPPGRMTGRTGPAGPPPAVLRPAGRKSRSAYPNKIPAGCPDTGPAAARPPPPRISDSPDRGRRKFCAPAPANRQRQTACPGPYSGTTATPADSPSPRRETTAGMRPAIRSAFTSPP